MQDQDSGEEEPASIARSLAATQSQQRNLIDQPANLGGSVATLVTEELASLDRERRYLIDERGATSGRRATWLAAQARVSDLAK